MLGFFSAIILAAVGQVFISDHDLRGLIPTALAVATLLIVLWRDGGQAISALGFAAAEAPTGSSAPIGTHLEAGRFSRPVLLTIATASAVLAIIATHDNSYRWYGVIAWVIAIGLVLAAFWEPGPESIRSRISGIRPSRWHPGWTLIAAIGLVLIAILFRFWRLGQMPSEMTSDHIEKLLDVHDVVTGKRPIFFVRNTGREPWQFYWTFGLIRLFRLETKFFALKLGTALVSLITLPGVFLLGRELFGRWVGLWAMLFVAVASWPVILSRIGLRFPFAPAVTAWSLLFLLRGLRGGRRNDFLMLGLTLGIGLHGYTAFRAMPLAVALCWAIALVFRPKSLSIHRSRLLRNAALTVLIAGVVLIPLGRFSLEHPDSFWRRSVSRIVDPYQPTPDGPIVTLVKNLRNLALMFHWQGDDVWVNALSVWPILDPLLGGLLILGLVTALWLGLKDAIPLLLLLCGFVLLLPSALSLAYPVENPSAVRTGGAIPVVMVIAALPAGLAANLSSEENSRQSWGSRGSNRAVGLARAHWRGVLLIAGALTLAVTVTVINFQRYFVDYWNQYEQNALNTTEIAGAIRSFVDTGGAATNAWIVAWPYWIDTRGVGIELGDPPWNNVILAPEELDKHSDVNADEISSNPHEGLARFYVLHTEDTGSLDQLHKLFPHGRAKLAVARHPERSFVTFYVPPSQSRLSKGVNDHAP